MLFIRRGNIEGGIGTVNGSFLEVNPFWSTIACVCGIYYTVHKMKFKDMSGEQSIRYSRGA